MNKTQNSTFIEAVLHLDTFKVPDRQLGVPRRIGHAFTGIAEKFNELKISPALPDTSYSTFTCFQRLPYDIRYLVWKLAASVPRNLDIWPLSIGALASNHNPDVELTPQMWRIFTTSPIPSILHATQESRTIGSKFYVLSFGVKHQCPSYHGATITMPPRVYYNLEVDRVCLMISPAHEASNDTYTWVSIVKRVFNKPGMSVAIHFWPVSSKKLFLRSSFLSIFDKHKEVLFFVLHNINHQQPPRRQVFLKFADWTRKGDVVEGVPSFGPEFKTIMRMAIDSEFEERFDLLRGQGDGPSLPVIKWASLETIA